MPKIQKMKIVLFVVGKTKEKYLLEGMYKYQRRIMNYINFEICEIPNIKKTKNISNSDLMQKEGDLILKKLQSSDYLILLDEKEKMFSSSSFAKKIQSWMLSGKKRIVFVIGGAYGFYEDIYTRANEKISLSRLTFSHQMVRLFFVEQLYRGYTILNNEPYHHE